jgi:hypothetical protein
MATGKFWTRGFSIGFFVSSPIFLVGGLYFLLISGLTERSNPIGGLFAWIGLLLVLFPAGLILARTLWLRKKR